MIVSDVVAQARDTLLRIAGRPVLGSGLRRHPRFPCFVPVRLSLVERGYALDGAVNEVSRGGVRFREASTFILNRHGAKVTLNLLAAELEGEIVNISPMGYGIRLSSLLDEDFVEAVTDLTRPDPT
jgi:hypothetical protein